MVQFISLANDIIALARGSQSPEDPQYVSSYMEVFDAMKFVIQGKYGFISYLKQRMNIVNSDNEDYEVSGLDKSSIYQYLSNFYDYNLSNRDSLSNYVDATSLALYSAVIGRERVIFTDIEKNLREYYQEILAELDNQKRRNWCRVDNKNALSEDPEDDIQLKKHYLDNFLYIFNEYEEPSILSGVTRRITRKDIEFFCLFLGKVIEGSLSQGRKSKGGDIAEKIVEVLIKKNGLNVASQVKAAATNTDLVITQNGKKYCIAVQLSTNDRMRLSSDEFHIDSDRNYLVSLNGCQVSRKNIDDISFQRMASWMEKEIIYGQEIAYFVGIEPFINNIKELYFNEFNRLIGIRNHQTIAKTFLDSDINTLRHYLAKLPESYLQTKFLLALWAHRKAISFEQFIYEVSN